MSWIADASGIHSCSVPWFLDYVTLMGGDWRAPITDSWFSRKPSLGSASVILSELNHTRLQHWWFIFYIKGFHPALLESLTKATLVVYVIYFILFYFQCCKTIKSYRLVDITCVLWEYFLSIVVEAIITAAIHIGNRVYSDALFKSWKMI